MNPEPLPPAYDGSIAPEQKYAPGTDQYNNQYGFQSPPPPENMYAAPPAGRAGYVGLRVSAPYALQTSNYPTQPAGAYAQPNPPEIDILYSSPPSAPAYPNNYQNNTVNVSIAPTVIAPGTTVWQTLGRYPVIMTCPKCSAQIQTQVDYQVSEATWLMCLIIFGIGCLGTIILGIGFILWFFCCVPCFINDCKEAVHTCPNCRAHVGSVKSVHL